MKFILVVIIYLEIQHIVQKKDHTFTQLIAVNKEGRIWYVSRSYPGSNSEYQFIRI